MNDSTTFAVQLAAVMTVIGGVVSSVLTVLYTKGVPSWVVISKEKRAANLEKRKLEMESRKYEDGQAELSYMQMVESYKFVVNNLVARVTTVEAELRSARAEHEVAMHTARVDHMECVKTQALLQGQLNRCLEDIKKLSESEKRHAAANTENVENIKEYLHKAAAVKTEPETL